MTEIIWALIQGVVQGITEFLPVSSTGHLIVVDHFLKTLGGFEIDESFGKMFDVVIQLASILAVVIYFHKKLFPLEMLKNNDVRDKTFSIWLKTLTGVLPAIVIGALFSGFIRDYLMNPITVAVALLVGGVVLIAVDSGEDKKGQITDISQFSFKRAFSVGLIQCLAMIPGTSRSAATIIGGMCLGCSRPLAAEYSFFLAIPTMVAATGYTLMKYGLQNTTGEWLTLGIGFITAFFVSWAVIAVFMVFIKSHSFRVFAYYRIALGILIISLLVAKVI